MGYRLKRQEKQDVTNAAICDVTPCTPDAPPTLPTIRVPVMPKRCGHTTRSPLPHDFSRTKPVETVNGGKKDKEYIRYRLTPEELQALKNAYPERRCQDATGARHRKRD